MFKKFLSLVLLTSLVANAVADWTDENTDQIWDCATAEVWRKKCKQYPNLRVCNLLTAGALSVSGNATIGGSLAVSGALTVGGTSVLTGLRSYGQAFANASQVATGNVVFAGGASQNSGVTVAGSNITLANAGIYYVRYSVVFTLIAPLTANTNVSDSIDFSLNSVPVPAIGAGGFIPSVDFFAPVSSNLQTGTLAELTGGFFITTTAVNSILTLGVTLGTGTAIPGTSAPDANVTVEIIQVG
jgi:hypothetical protein